MKLTIPSIHYLALAPVLIFFGAALVLLFAAALARRTLSRTVSTVTTLSASLASVVVAFFQWADVSRHGASTTIAHAVAYDHFAIVGSAVVAVCVGLSALVAHDWATREGSGLAEYTMLALCSAAGAMVMVSANDLLVLFLGLEILSIGLYVLVAFDRHRGSSLEAALKYFLLGGFASAVFIYGVALMYGATGTTTLTGVAYFLGATTLVHPGLLWAGGALLLVGFAFKVAAVPFHLWSPDVYQGAPTPVTGFMASIVKIGAFVGFVRVILSGLGTQIDTWRPTLWVLVVLSTVVGATLALVQRDVKRLLAYSSINHAGFMLLALWAGDLRGVASLVFYLLAYAPVVVATFAVVTLVGGPGDEAHSVEHYRGLGRRQPVLGTALSVLLLSQLGAPLTVGFFAKFGVLGAAVNANAQVLALIALLAAAVAAYVYLRWILALWDSSASDEGAARIAVPRASATVIAVVCVASVLFGVWPGPLAALAQHATALFLP